MGLCLERMTRLGADWEIREIHDAMDLLKELHDE